MKPNSHIGAGALAFCALIMAMSDPVSAQVDGLSSGQRTFDLDPSTQVTSVGSCNVTGIAFQGDGQQLAFDIIGTAQAFDGAGTDLYDVQLTMSEFGNYPDGFLFGHAEVRSTNGDVCELDMSTGFEASTCESMFSSDGAFTIVFEALSGASPD
jgi:hypothetical protein